MYVVSGYRDVYDGDCVSGVVCVDAVCRMCVVRGWMSVCVWEGGVCEWCPCTMWCVCGGVCLWWCVSVQYVVSGWMSMCVCVEGRAQAVLHAGRP